MHTLGVIRLIGNFKDFHRRKYILSSFRRQTFDFELFKFPSLESFHSRVMKGRHPIDKYRENEMRQTNNFCSRYLFFLNITIFLNLFATYVVNYFEPTYEKFNPTVNGTSLYRDYAYGLWYPFDTSISDGFYLLGFFYQPYAFFYLMDSLACIYTFEISSVIYLTSQAHVVAYAFGFVDKNIDESMCYEGIIQLKKIRIVKCINELQEIYRCAIYLNKMLSTQMLVQISFLCIIPCTLMYNVEAVNSIGEFFYLSSQIVVIFSTAFVMCWYNQVLTLTIMQVENSVNKLNWDEYDTKLRKILVFLIARLQKPFQMTLANWVPINIAAFLAMVKMSYSVYTLIKNSKNEVQKQ
ncbi:odorant receptor 2a-like [Sitophilus oryzae]|uniref:Odorant receptor n=1 Tax=Sitophilus oryzae TaxID=7048 RepID=A0A6J2XUF9_SITOR|nr:odorant receptor 2a-like [Sitophilus oryzae]